MKRYIEDELSSLFELDEGGIVCRQQSLTQGVKILLIDDVGEVAMQGDEFGIKHPSVTLH